MDQELLTILTQFGPAGLIGLLWIIERRHAAVRERQLSESHGKIMVQDQTLDATIGVIKENTRAIVALEQTQRHLIDLARHIGEAGRGERAASATHA